MCEIGVTSQQVQVYAFRRIEGQSAQSWHAPVMDFAIAKDETNVECLFGSPRTGKVWEGSHAMSHGLSPSNSDSSVRRFAAINVLVAVILASSFTLQTAAPASASIGWCRSDPVVVLDHAIADVFTSAKWSDLSKVTGATQVVIVIPSTVRTVIGIPTLGFGYGERVSFERSTQLNATWSRIDVIVKVFVPSTDSSMPIRVTFAPRLLGLLWPTSAEGHANSWIVFNAVL